MKWIFSFSILVLLFFHRPERFEFYNEIPHSSKSITLHLPERFTYLGEGAQMIAFQSVDQTTVLKLFKKAHKKPFKLSRMVRHFQHKDWKLSRQKWHEKFHATCACYALAYEHLQEETGLIALHFEQTDTPLPVILVDRTIDLANLPFILQKKAILAPEYFKKHPEKKTEAAQALKDFFTKRLEKGFSDPRQSLSINYGFINDKPIQLDVGKLEPFEGDAEAELNKIHAHIDQWVSNLFLRRFSAPS